MANGENKTPTWQWVAATAVSILLIMFGYGFVETRTEIKEAAKSAIEVSARVSVLEKANELQFKTIELWRFEIKTQLDKISSSQEKAVDMFNRHLSGSAAMKRWQDVPASR